MTSPSEFSNEISQHFEIQMLYIRGIFCLVYTFTKTRISLTSQNIQKNQYNFHRNSKLFPVQLLFCKFKPNINSYENSKLIWYTISNTWNIMDSNRTIIFWFPKYLHRATLTEYQPKVLLSSVHCMDCTLLELRCTIDKGGTFINYFLCLGQPNLC